MCEVTDAVHSLYVSHEIDINPLISRNSRNRLLDNYFFKGREQDTFQPAQRGHCHLTLFHLVVMIFSSCIDLHIEACRYCISSTYWQHCVEHIWSRILWSMTEWWWHTRVLIIAVFVRLSFQICKFGILVEEKMRKYKEVNQWQTSKIGSKCERKKNVPA